MKLGRAALTMDFFRNDHGAVPRRPGSIDGADAEPLVSTDFSRILIVLCNNADLEMITERIRSGAR